MYKSITGNIVQDNLVTAFMDSRYFGDQHWFAARAEIEALWARVKEQEAIIKELESKISEKGSAPSGKSDKVKGE